MCRTRGTTRTPGSRTTPACCSTQWSLLCSFPGAMAYFSCCQTSAERRPSGAGQPQLSHDSDHITPTGSCTLRTGYPTARLFSGQVSQLRTASCTTRYIQEEARERANGSSLPTGGRCVDPRRWQQQVPSASNSSQISG